YKISFTSPMAREVVDQRELMSSLLGGKDWSGRVFKDVGYYELEHQRLLDRLLVQQGATEFSVVHGARLDPQEVIRRSLLIENAQAGDVTITRQDANVACQGDQVQIKTFSVCLLK